MSVGILGTGIYLPPDVRRNDWWPQELVDRWMQGRGPAPSPSPTSPQVTTRGRQLVLEEMQRQKRDPFQGAVERRVLAPELRILDMEEQAARSAIEDAGIDASHIDVLLTHSVVPDYMLSNPGCGLHQRLGLRRACLTMHADAAAYSFLGQLALAEAMIAAGRARYALLVQSCVATRLIDREDPGSPLVGDGASAVIVGPTRSAGFRGFAHFSDGNYPRTLIMSVRGGTWYADGPAPMHVADAAQMQEVFLQTADVCKESVDTAVSKAGVSLADIDFLCVYQGTPWLRRVVQSYLGLEHCRSFETFERYGYLSSAMIPINLALASRERALEEGDLVLLTGGGTGMTFGACVLQWGRE